VEDRAALVVREAQVRVLRVEAKNAVALVYARENVEGLVWMVALLDGELCGGALGPGGGRGDNL
jgi:hypothetical protein